MLILLKIAAILALIILPLISPAKKNKRYTTNSEISGFVVDEDGDIHSAHNDKTLRPRAHKK